MKREEYWYNKVDGYKFKQARVKHSFEHCGKVYDVGEIVDITDNIHSVVLHKLETGFSTICDENSEFFKCHMEII